ncbi:hypothetical protein F0562_001828 [Nyssa sinensis]|uniref:Uncharacterized protein n=1 Tax=Nyssa sinensis TaxID=561372 RepID=A0A5J5C5B5_9ASTE|nr:hypothetical protein F0562_001828 [Nyssa sinensis]
MIATLLDLGAGIFAAKWVLAMWRCKQLRLEGTIVGRPDAVVVRKLEGGHCGCVTQNCVGMLRYGKRRKKFATGVVAVRPEVAARELEQQLLKQQ